MIWPCIANMNPVGLSRCGGPLLRPGLSKGTCAKNSTRHSESGRALFQQSQSVFQDFRVADGLIWSTLPQ